MSIPKEKHVILAVEDSKLPHSITKHSGLHRMKLPVALKLLEDAGKWWGPRGVLETDRRFRQIIPYVFLRDPETNRFLTYFRGQDIAEARLAGKACAGFGGHIDIGDIDLGYNAAGTGPNMEDFHLRDTVYTAMARELREEAGLEFVEAGQFIGLLIDYDEPENPLAVGHVHIGMVFVCDVNPDLIKQQEDAVLISDWMTMDEFADIPDSKEGWSLACAGTLRSIYTPGMTDLMVEPETISDDLGKGDPLVDAEVVPARERRVKPEGEA